MEEEEKYRIIRHQKWNKRHNDKKILRRTDVYYCVVVGRLDLDLNPLHLITGNPLFTHAHWFVPYPYFIGIGRKLLEISQLKDNISHLWA